MQVFPTNIDRQDRLEKIDRANQERRGTRPSLQEEITREKESLALANKLAQQAKERVNRSLIKGTKL